jgi:hypothetical protein
MKFKRNWKKIPPDRARRAGEGADRSKKSLKYSLVTKANFHYGSVVRKLRLSDPEIVSGAYSVKRWQFET